MMEENQIENVGAPGRPGLVLRPNAATPEAVQINHLRLWWARKWWILLGTLLGCAAGIFWSIWQIPEYDASTTVEMVGFNESFMGLNQFDPQAGTGAYSGTLANIQTQERILLGSSLRKRAIQRLGMETAPVGPASVDVFSIIRNRLGILSQDPTEFTQMAIRTASSTLSVHGVGLSRLLTIDCQAPSPEIAAAFANALANEYVSDNAQVRASSATRTSQWLEGQIEENKGRLEEANTKLQDFIKKEGLEFVVDQNTLADSKLKQLQQDLSALQIERVGKQSRYELATSSPVDSLPEILDDGTLRGLRDQLTALRRDRAQLTATLMPDHYKVRRIDAQIGELEQTQQREKANLVKRIQNEYEAALRREKLTTAAYSAQSHALADQASKTGQYELLKRQVEMAQQAFNALTVQYNQAALAAAVPANTVRIVDPATASGAPLRPKPLHDTLVATLFGAGLAIILCIVAEKIRLRQLSRVFASPGHLAPVLNLPELGVIPKIIPASQQGMDALNPGRLLVSGREGGVEGGDTVQAFENSSLADSFRYALTSILGRQAQHEHLTLVVTSPGPGEGKTTLAGNLAVATAQTGRSVLLIDADLRRPRLHKLFDLQINVGFADLISSEANLSSVDMMAYIQPTSTDNLYVLTVGNITSEQLGSIMFSARISKLLTRLRNNFDVILIDTPPALQFPDARLLGHLSDGVVLIVRSGMTFRTNAIAAAERFAQDGVSIIGTILNDWDAEASLDGGRGFYRYNEKYTYNS